MSVCGLLVVDHTYGLSPARLLDDETWLSQSSWIVCTASVQTKNLIEKQGNNRIQRVIVEPDRRARYNAGMKAAIEHAAYVLLFHPGTGVVHLKPPAYSDIGDAVCLQYVGRNNLIRWRRTMVRSDLEWYYDDASAQWERSGAMPEDTVDRYSVFRENPQVQHTLIEWSRQLQAQISMLRSKPDAQHLSYEIGLSNLRLAESEIAYDWFHDLYQNPDAGIIYRSVAATMMALLNKRELPVETQIHLYQEANKIWPNLADNYFYLAEALLKQNKAETALEIASSWRNQLSGQHSALDSTMVQTRLPRLVALCHAELGQHQRAIASLNKALHINDKYYFASSEADSQSTMHQQRDDLYQKAFPMPQCKHSRQNKFKIVVAFWNAAEFLPDCVRSIASQDYQNYEVIFVDDASSDGGLQNVDLTGLAAYKIVTQTNRQGPLKNQVEAVIEHCSEDDIVVVLDGDDALADPGVLSHLDDVYSALDCWVTIGQFKVRDDWRWGYARPILPDEDIAEIFTRQTLRFPVHLRTHRAGLFHRLVEIDPGLDAFRDNAGNFFFYASDVAYCRVIMSLAGANKIRYISRILMDYNVKNPQSVHNKNRESQTQSCIEIAKLEALPKLQGYQA